MQNSDGSLDAIDDIPVPLSDPEFESPLAWEIMWSDPVNSSYQVSEEEESSLKANKGFMFNSRRGNISIYPAFPILASTTEAHVTYTCT